MIVSYKANKTIKAYISKIGNVTYDYMLSFSQPAVTSNRTIQTNLYCSFNILKNFNKLGLDTNRILIQLGLGLSGILIQLGLGLSGIFMLEFSNI